MCILAGQPHLRCNLSECPRSAYVIVTMTWSADETDALSVRRRWQITWTNKIASNARYQLFSRHRTSPTAQQYRSVWPCQPSVCRITHFTPT